MELYFLESDLFEVGEGDAVDFAGVAGVDEAGVEGVGDEPLPPSPADFVGEGGVDEAESLLAAAL